MSEIRATTISDSAGTGPITLTGQKGTKAHAYVGSDAAISGGFNFSSGVDNGTGNYTVSLTNSMSGSLYSITVNPTDTAQARMVSTSGVSGTGYTILCFDSSGTATNLNTRNSVIGDLA